MMVKKNDVAGDQTVRDRFDEIPVLHTFLYPISNLFTSQWGKIQYVQAFNVCTVEQVFASFLYLCILSFRENLNQQQ